MKPDFYVDPPQLFPAKPGIGKMYSSSPRFAWETAFRNGTLQGAYLVVAARAPGLDCDPKSGFYPEKVDELSFR